MTENYYSFERDGKGLSMKFSKVKPMFVGDQDFFRFEERSYLKMMQGKDVQNSLSNLAKYLFL